MNIEEPTVTSTESGELAVILPESKVKRVPTLLMAAIDEAIAVAVDESEDPGVREMMVSILPDIATVLDKHYGIIR